MLGNKPKALAKFWRSSTTRFILLVFGIELILAASITLTLRGLTRAELQTDARAYAARMAQDIGRAYRTGNQQATQEAIFMRLVFSEGRTAIALLADKKGMALAGNLDRWPMGLQAGWNEIHLSRPGKKETEHIGVLVTPLPQGAKLLTGQILEADKRLSAILDRATGTALIFALPLALLAALAAVRIINARVDDIAETANAVRAGHLSKRVGLDGSGDTFDRLGATLNAMLDRVEALISELRIVTDGLAHDLRSPLTRLKARLDQAAKAEDTGRLQSAVAEADHEADRLLDMLTTALQISRAEAGIGRDHFAPLHLNALVDDLAELYGPLAEDRGFDLLVTANPCPAIDGHRELLSQAISNLIDNALKYGASPLCLTTGATDTSCWLCVEDHGPGIAPDAHAEALRRFGRLDPARTGFGAGLGLSLVAAVARLHGGHLSLSDAGPGLAVRLVLPRPATDQGFSTAAI